jgi:hypothetical protein
MRVAHAIIVLLVRLAFVSTRELSAQERKEIPSSSGNAFLRLCSVIDESEMTPLEKVHKVACLEYLEGFTHGVLAEVEWAHAITGKEPPPPYCRPEHVENGQLVRIVLKYIRNHPETAQKPTAALVVEALLEAFPCASK